MEAKVFRREGAGGGISLWERDLQSLEQGGRNSAHLPRSLGSQGLSTNSNLSSSR